MNSHSLFFFLHWFCSEEEAAAERKPEAYRKAILACKAGASGKEMDDALRILDADDAEVVFELGRHLESEAVAAAAFQGTDPQTGKLVEHQPTIGEVALMLIQRKIEALEPGRRHTISIIDGKNAKGWIDARQNLNLREMQRDAAQEGVVKATKHHIAHPDEFSLADLNLYQANLQSVMAGKPPRYSSWVKR